MSAIVNELLRWKYDGDKKGIKRPFYPMSQEEIHSIWNDPALRFQLDQSKEHPGQYRFMGHEVFRTPFAPEMRVKQFQVGSLFVSEALAYDDRRIAQSSELQSFRSDMMRELVMRLKANVLGDTQVIEVPVNGTKVKLEARTLYPYVDIKLPHNRHHVTFAVPDNTPHAMTERVDKIRDLMQEKIDKALEGESPESLDDLLKELGKDGQ